MYFDEIKSYLVEQAEPAYRFKQICEAIFQQKITDFTKMQALPKALRINLEERFGFFLKDNLAIQESAEQATKVLFRFQDGEKVEAVEMSFHGLRQGKCWKSLCLSSQIGCNLKCAFCATGKIGLKRNMTADEIIQQVSYFHLYSGPIHSISFMGMGEALLNPEIFPALAVLIDERYFNFSPRHITISTSGIIPGLVRLINEFPQVNIAYSLHSPFAEERQKLMPISRRYPIDDVMHVLDEHILAHHRKVFLSYVMLAGINDDERHLQRLIKLVKERPATAAYYHINLIRYNNTPGNNTFRCAERARIDYFLEALQKQGIHATLRQSFGRKISAACGQLYGKYQLKDG